MSLLDKYENASSITKMAQELWDMVSYNLPAFDARSAARIFGYQLRASQESHSELWSSIFQDNTWISKATTQFGLNPVLIGRDLHPLCDTTHRRKGQSWYLILVSRDTSGEFTLERDLFLRSLRPHSYDKRKMEVEFASGLTLNVGSVWRDPEIVIAKLDRVFSYQHQQLRTAYVFWHDEYPVVRTLGPEGIVGIGGKAFRLPKVLDICGLTVTQPGGRCVQHILENNNDLNRPVMLMNEPRGVDECESWRWA